MEAKISVTVEGSPQSEMKRSLHPDIESPTFKGTCPFNIYQHADRMKNHTGVTWPTVAAYDNSGKRPHLVSSGVKDVYYQGKHIIQFNATDDAGNQKTCRFEITVTGKTVITVIISITISSNLIGQ